MLSLADTAVITQHLTCVSKASVSPVVEEDDKTNPAKHSQRQAPHALHEVSADRDGPFELRVSQRVKQPQKNHRLIVDQ